MTGVLRRQLLLFFGAAIAVGVALGINESILTNFLLDEFGLTAKGRGWLEFPREFPGLMVVLMAGVLCALPVSRVAVVGAGVFAGGLAGIAVLGSSFWPMVLMMMVASAGMHLLQPVNAALAIGLSGESNRGRRIGQMGAISTAGTILGSGAIWLFMDERAPRYATAFLGAGVVAFAAGLLYAFMHVPHLHQPRSRIVVKRKYGLYYLLEFLFGARKQIFLTFGFWVLAKVYAQPAGNIAFLLMVCAVIGLVFKPMTGHAIDRLGERVVLVVDGLALAVVCIGYGYAEALFRSPGHALFVAKACFVLDQLLFALGTGRTVYVSRLTETPEEMTSTLSMGISINHIASMFIPAIAGGIWVRFGYSNVFLGAAVLALIISAVASRVPAKGALLESAEG